MEDERRNDSKMRTKKKGKENKRNKKDRDLTREVKRKGKLRRWKNQSREVRGGKGVKERSKEGMNAENGEEHKNYKRKEKKY